MLKRRDGAASDLLGSDCAPATNRTASHSDAGEAAITVLADRIEFALSGALQVAAAPDAPPKLAAAMRHAVFPGGARIRPTLCLAVAGALGDPYPVLSDAAAAAIELIHCASLVHDDLGCFDNSALRRGRPSVPAQFGNALAVLAGDALIVQGFDTLARAAIAQPAPLPRLVLILASCSGMPNGIAGGQGWECEPGVDLAAYGSAKTGALFAAAAMSGAVCAGQDPEPWRRFGNHIGQAYQVADDLADVHSDSAAMGKPAGRDRALGRPNAALQLGTDAALMRLDALLEEALDAIPPCADRDGLRHLVCASARRLLPDGAVPRAA